MSIPAEVNRRVAFALGQAIIEKTLAEVQAEATQQQLLAERAAHKKELASDKRAAKKGEVKP